MLLSGPGRAHTLLQGVGFQAGFLEGQVRPPGWRSPGLPAPGVKPGTRCPLVIHSSTQVWCRLDPREAPSSWEPLASTSCPSPEGGGWKERPRDGLRKGSTQKYSLSHTHTHTHTHTQQRCHCEQPHTLCILHSSLRLQQDDFSSRQTPQVGACVCVCVCVCVCLCMCMSVRVCVCVIKLQLQQECVDVSSA